MRQLTHTVHLPPAQSEIYDGPHAEWLRELLEQLPNLQSLVVSQLPFFDHSALLALRQSSSGENSGNHQVFPLRLLVASQCSNTTSASLGEALLHWPNLVFLDLSDTLAARDHAVLSSFQYMTGLQDLKLRHVNLRDEDVDVLADAIGVRVRSLDVRNNRITDISVRKLLNTCFRPPMNTQGGQRNGVGSPWDTAHEDWPSGIPRPYSFLLDEFRGNDLDERFVKRLTKGMVSRLPSEDLPPSGLTHLYIADNFITVEGVASLVKSGNLNVIDAGSVDTAKALVRPRARSSTSRQMEFSISLPGAEKLTPVLSRYAEKNLTYLRIHYTVVTELPPVKGDPAYPFELSAEEPPVPELDAEEAPVYELDATVPVYELMENNTSPRFELPGDPIHVMVSPAVGEKPSIFAEQQEEVRRGSIFAPEPISSMSIPDDETRPSVYSTNADSDARVHFMNSARGSDQTNDFLQERPLSRNLDSTSLHEVPFNSHQLSSIVERRQKLRSINADKPKALIPGALPMLRSIVLTNVPSHDSDYHIVNALKNFIRDCAEEAKLADIQASLEHKSLYVPGKPRSMYRQHRTRELFALQRLVLEMVPPGSAKTVSSTPLSPLTPPPRSDFSRGRSSTEDPDSEAFWLAQENDFSFFGDEECGLPENEPGMHFPIASLSEKMLLPMESTGSTILPTLQKPKEQSLGVDVVEELTKYRKERKMTYEHALRTGEKYVDGYWPGEVNIVRYSGRSAMYNGNLDWYGNYFEKGVYR